MAILLEINVISAQSLSKPPSPSSASIRNLLHPYALLSLPPFPRLRTRVDPANHSNPTWNDRFVFLLPSPLPLSPSSSASLSLSLSLLSKSPLPLLPDAPLGSSRILLSSLNLLSRPLDTPLFSAFGIRRRSGRVKGVLNVAFTLLSRVSARTRNALDVSGAVGYRDLIGDRLPFREVNSEADLQLCGFGGTKKGSGARGRGGRRRKEKGELRRKVEEEEGDGGGDHRGGGRGRSGDHRWEGEEEEGGDGEGGGKRCEGDEVDTTRTRTRHGHGHKIIFSENEINKLIKNEKGKIVHEMLKMVKRHLVENL